MLYFEVFVLISVTCRMANYNGGTIRSYAATAGLGPGGSPVVKVSWDVFADAMSTVKIMYYPP